MDAQVPVLRLSLSIRAISAAITVSIKLIKLSIVAVISARRARDHAPILEATTEVITAESFPSRSLSIGGLTLTREVQRRRQWPRISQTLAPTITDPTRALTHAQMQAFTLTASGDLNLELLQSPLPTRNRDTSSSLKRDSIAAHPTASRSQASAIQDQDQTRVLVQKNPSLLTVAPHALGVLPRR